MSLKKTSIKKDALKLSALASALLCAQQSYAAMPLAGETIQNIAYASYQVLDENGQQTLYHTQSNPVNVKVSEIYGLDLQPDSLKQVEAGAKVIWLNQLTNLSNTPAWFDFQTSEIHDLSQVKIYIDSNQDGVFDASDRLLTEGLYIQPNETAQLWVVADTSSQMADQAIIELPVTAHIRELPEYQASVKDPVQVIQPKLKIEKAVDQTYLTANTQAQLLNYTLNISNTASTVVRPTLVNVDGQMQSLVIVEDPLPANTTFENLEVLDHPQAVEILHRLADGQYTRHLPTDKTKIGYAVVAYKNSFPAQQKSIVRLSVKTHANLSYTTLVNEAYVLHATAQFDQKKTLSNQVETKVDGQAKIDSTTGNFSESLYTGRVNEPLYIKTNASICNANRFTVDQVRIQIRSALTGDLVTVIAKESGENTGVFQFELATQEQANAVLTDQIFQTLKRDTANIRLTDCLDENGQSTLSIADIETDVLIDPYGTVFDAKSGQPVAGATVILVDEFGRPIEDNIAFEIDRLTGELKSIPAKQVTNERGEFTYPLVKVGSYKLLIDTSTVPGKKYSFVSDQVLYPIDSFNGKQVHSEWSYGGKFTLTSSSPALNIDIPIDPELSQAALMVQKTARDSTVELGDFTNYSITVTNQGHDVAEDVKLQDTLPRGFSYVPNTMRIDGKPVADPLGGIGPYLTLGLGQLAANSSAKIEYRVQIGPNALNGDGINRARAVDRHGVQSNEAQAKVKVRPGVFSSDAFIVGKVYTDCNRNGMQDSGELGVPGVRIFMEDGSYVVTDREGKYDFYGISPKTHVLKVDSTTLPADAELIIQSNRNVGDPASRFVDVKRGELHRADFALANEADTCSAPLIDAVQQRRDKINQSNFNLEKAINQQLSIDVPVYNTTSTRSENTSGCVASEGGQDCLLNRKPTDAVKTDKNLAIEPKSPDQLTALEDLLKRSDDNALRILNLQSGQVMKFNQTTLQIQGAAGANQRVQVNGQVVSEKQIGKRSVLAEQRKQGLEYIGVALVEGQNKIVVEQLDFLGNVRESTSVDVLVPGKPQHLTLSTQNATAIASGTDVLKVSVKLTDENGTPILVRTPILLETDIGVIDLPDANPNEAGVQTFIENGELIVPILAPSVPGRGRLRVSSGSVQQEHSIQFTADLRPLIAVGMVEGAIHFNNFDQNQIHSVNRNDGFEDELKELADFGDDVSAHGRAAMYLKGKVKGDYLLTLAYDSDKGSKQRLFRDIQPDEYYPIYGDAAAKGFDAQSTSKLYVRVDKGRSYAMYGDYITRTDQNEGLSLGQYNRSLTGVKVGHDSDRLQVSAFGAQTRSRQVVNESRAMGVTGPYSLGSISNDLILENSEKVEILTRDRNNPGLIIDKRVLTRFVDYEIDAYSNSIYLKEAIASVDADLNPNYVRVTVEAEEIGEEYEVAGVSFSYAMPSHLKLGGSFVQSNDPLQNEQIASANAVLKVGQYGKLVAEIAHAENEDTTLENLAQVGQTAPEDETSGFAGRVEFDYSHNGRSIQMYHHQADAGFKNDAATINSGRIESGIKASATVSSLGTARLEAIRTEDQVNDGVRTGLSASIERSFLKVLALETGLRFYDETNAGATLATDATDAYSGTTGRVKLTAQLPWQGASVFTAYEQDLSESDNKVLTVGGRAKVNDKTELYAHHELISAIDGLYSLNSTEETNSTVFGISSAYMKDGSAFSEYRVADGMSNREAEAALGLKNRWEVQPKVFLSTTFEKIKSLSADAENKTDSTAATLGIEYLAADDWKAMTRLEGRWADDSNRFINTIGYARKLNDDLSLLSKNTLNYTQSQTAESGDHIRNRFQLGLAWRDFDSNQLDVLSKVEHYYEHNQSDLASEFKRQAYVSSTHVNYHPYRQLTLSGQYAAKWAMLDEDQVKSTALTQLFSGRVLYDINERWDAGFQAGVLWGNHGAGTRYLAGVEAGYLLATNLWVSAGYNFMGYQDDELANTSSTGEGAYLRFRFKFDENLFGRKNTLINPALEPQQGR